MLINPKELEQLQKLLKSEYDKELIIRLFVQAMLQSTEVKASEVQTCAIIVANSLAVKPEVNEEELRKNLAV